MPLYQKAIYHEKIPQISKPVSIILVEKENSNPQIWVGASDGKVGVFDIKKHTSGNHTIEFLISHKFHSNSELSFLQKEDKLIMTVFSSGETLLVDLDGKLQNTFQLPKNVYSCGLVEIKYPSVWYASKSGLETMDRSTFNITKYSINSHSPIIHAELIKTNPMSTIMGITENSLLKVDLSTKKIEVKELEESCVHIALSPDYSIAGITTESGKLSLWDANEFKPLYDLDSNVGNCSFKPSYCPLLYVAVWTNYKGITFVDLESKFMDYSEKTEMVDYCWLNDHVVTVSKDGYIKLIRVSTSEPLA